MIWPKRMKNHKWQGKAFDIWSKKRIITKDIFQPHKEILRIDLGSSYWIWHDYNSNTRVQRGKKTHTLQTTVYPRLKEIDNNNPWHVYQEFSSNKNECCTTIKNSSGDRVFCFALLFQLYMEKEAHAPTH